MKPAPGRLDISVAVDGTADETKAIEIGMATIRRSAHITDARFVRAYRPRPRELTFWRIEADYVFVRDRVPS